MEKSGRRLIYGGGFIGTAAALAFEQAGDAVTVVSRAIAPQGFNSSRWLYGSVVDTVSRELLGQHQSVIYAAGSMTPASQISSVSRVMYDHLLPVVALAEAAAEVGVANFVFMSSGGTVYGPDARLPAAEDDITAPINAYGMIKVQTEQALCEIARRSGMSVVILRVSNPYGPGQSSKRQLGFVAAAVAAAQHGTALTIWGDGSVTRDFVFIDDVVDAICRAARFRNGPIIINIGMGRETSLREVCRLVEIASGRPLALGFQPGRGVDVRRSVLNIERAAQVLGWVPRVALAQGIARTVDTLAMPAPGLTGTQSSP